MNRILIPLILIFAIAQVSWGQGSEPVFLISGKVLNERTMEPIEGKVVYEILPEGKEAGIARTNPINGSYKIILPRGKKYGYMGLAEGYYSVTQFLDASALDKYTEIEEQNLFMAPLEKDQVVRINNVFFKGRTAEITEASFPELTRFYQFLKLNKKVIIEIDGHTDNEGVAEDNQKLSVARAKAIYDFLIAKGIKEKRLTYKGFGQTQPIAFNSTDEGKKRNNRIEFVIISTGK
ncbi:MAG: hypothetical protein DRP35_08265 [Candidatus Zixiibacteriota bacterium]|nr:MAG: hypothetical protein DRP35_08265 [candidate division Zixibacteria bacterium]